MNLKKLGFEPDDKRDKGDVHRFIQNKMMLLENRKDFFSNLMLDLRNFYEIDFDEDFEDYMLNYFEYIVPKSIEKYERVFKPSKFEPYDFFYERLMIVYNLDMNLATKINSDLDFIIKSIFEKKSYITQNDFIEVIKKNKDIGRIFLD